MTEQAVRVLLVEDQELLRRGLASLLSLRSEIQVVGQASNGREAIEQVAALDPDVVLMDIRMPELDGVQATARLTAAQARAGVIILTTFQDDEYVFRGLEAGARGYLLKDIDLDSLIVAIRTVARGEALIQPEVTNQVLREFRRLRSDSAPASPSEQIPRGPSSALDLLTGREREILQLIIQGQSNHEIGVQLALSIGTVKNHVSSILAKLGVRDRVQAMVVARQLGLS